MTKVYAGNDTWEIHLDSGQSFVLNQDEIDEIVVESSGYEDIEIDRDEYKSTTDRLSEALESIKTEVKKWQDKEIKRPKYKAMIDDFADDINLIVEDNI